MSWMKRLMTRLTGDDDHENIAVMSGPPAMLAEGTSEAERPVLERPVRERPETVGEAPLVPTDFEATRYNLRPDEVVFDLSYPPCDDEPDTLSGWSPDPDVLSSACSHNPVTSVADRIQFAASGPQAVPFPRRSALERLLDPKLTYAEPFTPIP